MNLLERTHWIWDLDGTLTVPVHDFDSMRNILGIAPGVDLLTGVAAMSPDRAQWARQRIADWEDDLARQSRPQPDAMRLLHALHRKGRRMGILTRNRRPTALLTLDVLGVKSLFSPDDVLGREEAEAKPSPAGILHLLRKWQIDPQHVVMVGDYKYDLMAGRAAGVATVLVERRGPTSFRDLADCWVTQLDAVLGG